jgi:transketolase
MAADATPGVKIQRGILHQESETMNDQAQLDRLCINTLRTLSIDAIQKAHSGHPGTPMGAAPTVYCLWQRFLRYDPDNVNWANRDRFVLSNGHASALLYSLLYLSGVKAMNPTYEQVGRPAVTLDDIKNFRQAGSRCPGHPEYGWTSGVEATTGPLGQGVAVSVGMAIAERWLAATYNRPGYDLFNYNVYALCGDGCMMEGISSEAASLAGHLKLSNLCWIYDDNHVTIEGPTRITFTEDVAARFLGYGWKVTHVSDANDLDKLVRAYEQLKSEGIKARVISMPSWELFESQSQEYRDSVILTEIAARVAVEEASTFGWERYTGLQGTVLGMHTFGLSAPMKVVAQHFGFEPEHVVVAAKEQIARHATKR